MELCFGVKSAPYPSLRIALPVIDSDANCLLPWLGRHNLDKTYKCHRTELNIAFLVM